MVFNMTMFYFRFIALRFGWKNLYFCATLVSKPTKNGERKHGYKCFWQAVLEQNPDTMRTFFSDTAYINWHCSNEHFTVDEFIRANCEDAGEWGGTIERIEQIGDLIITVVNAYPTNRETSFHVVSFISIKEDKIVSIDEYWGDDGAAPQWRLDKKIGTAIC